MINYEKINRLAILGVTAQQIAVFLSTPLDNLDNTTMSDYGLSFTDYVKTKALEGDFLLLDKQFKLAMQGDRDMLKWLGSNRLGQAAKTEATLTARTDLRTIEEIEAEIQQLADLTNIKPYNIAADA